MYSGSDSNNSENTSSSSGIHSSSHSNYSDDEITLDSDDSDFSTNLRFIAYREQLVDYMMQ
jgi:hypothetical protein